LIAVVGEDKELLELWYIASKQMAQCQTQIRYTCTL
jgi:hypothetical protein